MKQIISSMIVETGIIIALTFLFVGVAMELPQSTLEAQVAPEVRGKKGMEADEHTVFLLRVDEKQNTLADRKGRFTPVVTGGLVMADKDYSKCLKFGDGHNNGISVIDDGKIVFAGGFTLEVLLYLEEEAIPNPGGMVARKLGSYSFSINNYKLNNDWMKFPADKVFTTSLKQYKEYPVDSETFYGAMTIPSNRWVHLAVTYDQELKVIRTWIDGGIDRTRYLARDGAAPLVSDPAKAFEFVKGMKNVRIAAVKFSRGAWSPGPVPALEAYVHQLPYEDKIAIDIDHIRRDLDRPLDVAVILESPAGDSTVVKWVTLTGLERQEIFIDAPKWRGVLYTLIVKAYARHRLVFSNSLRVANPRPGGKFKINRDKTVSVGDRKFFPLVIYNVFPEDYRTVADIGFTVIMPRGLSLRLIGLGGSDARALADIKTCLDEAQKQKVYLMVEGDTVFSNLSRVPLFKDHPALLGWMGFDEPSGSLEKVQESYNIVKLLDPDRPILCTQNNPSRFSETAEGADIIACDPYPLPDVPLRVVADSTMAAVKAVAGMKPVWTILDQYAGKRPDLHELRCMAYLAIISGANGIGIYAWDDRLDKKTGWWTKEHPEDVVVLSSVIRELKSLENILMVPNSGRKTAFGPQNSALHVSVKEGKGRIYLLIANDSRKEENGTLSVEGISNSTARCLVDGGNRKNIEFAGGRASLTIPPLGAAVYEIQ